MPWLIAYNRIDLAVTYNTVIENYPLVSKTVVEIVDPDLSLCLIKRIDEIIDIKNWDGKNKVLIAAEHMNSVYKYLKNQGVNENYFSIDRVIGSSESFMVNTSRYILCDAVVETGTTIKENNLEVWKTVLEKGQIKIGMYTSLQ